MALTVHGGAILTTDGTAQHISDAPALSVVVAELDAATLVAGDKLVVRWRVVLFSATRTIWEYTLMATGTQEGILTPPVPIPSDGGFLEVEQSAGTSGKDVGWMVLLL
jgi:hypothetical protein